MKTILFILAVVAAAAGIGSAQSSLYWDLPTTPGNVALASGGLAVELEPDGLFANPGALPEVKWRTVRASGLQWWQDIYAGSFTGVLPTKRWGVASLAIGYWSLGTMAALTSEGEPLGNIESQAITWGLGWGRRLVSNLNLGLQCKGYSFKMPDRRDWSWAADLGAHYRYQFLSGSVLVRNLGPKYPANNVLKFQMPTSWNLGIRGTFLGQMAVAGLLLTAPRGQKAFASAGIEFRPVAFASIQMGYDTDDTKPERSPLGLGLGVHRTGTQDYSVEYGFRSYGALGTVHAVSVGMIF